MGDTGFNVWIEVEEAARIIGINHRAILRKIHSGELLAEKDTPEIRERAGYKGKLRWRLDLDQVLCLAPLGNYYFRRIESYLIEIEQLKSTIDADTERIKDLESYQSILKDDLRMRDGKIIQLQGQIEALEKADAILQEDKAMLHKESHKRGLKIKELLEEIKRLKYVLRETAVAREDWRKLYKDLRDSQPVSIWQKIAWVFTH
jgi:hypothetical protein